MSQQLQLLSKITIGGQELSNRVVLAPLTRGRYVRSDPRRMDMGGRTSLLSSLYILTHARTLSLAPHTHSEEHQLMIHSILKVVFLIKNKHCIMNNVHQVVC